MYVEFFLFVIRNTQCYVHNTQCYVHNTQCYVHNTVLCAQHTMLCAQHTMLYAQHSVMCTTQMLCAQNTNFFNIFLAEELKSYNNNNSLYVGLFNINT